MSRRIKISVDDSLLGAPEERPRIDANVRRRIVRMLPVPMPGIGQVMRPAIWTSPTKHLEPSLGKEVISHVVLIRRGPPVDIGVVNVIADEAVNCPDGVVECQEIVSVDSLIAMPGVEEPLRGVRRAVPLIPLPTGMMCPCIWLSPYDMADDDLKQRVQIAVILLGSGAPKPEVAAVRVPKSVIKKFPTGSVEW